MSRVEQSAASPSHRGNAWIRFVAAALVALLVTTALIGLSPASTQAHAPGIAVAEFDQPLLEAPAGDGGVLAELPAGSEMELTGSASGQYVEVAAGGAIGWVDVNLIHAGQIQTATTNSVTNITAEPSDDGQLLTVVPAGETVILTGAAVEDFLAGSYEGTGGWLPASHLQ